MYTKNASLARSRAHLRLPREQLSGALDVRLALLRIVFLLWHLDDFALAADEIANYDGEILDRMLVGIAEIDGQRRVAVHKANEAVDQIVNKLKRSRLRTLAVDRQRTTLKRLNNKVAHNPAVIHVHSWAESIEDARDSNLNLLLQPEPTTTMATSATIKARVPLVTCF